MHRSQERYDELDERLEWPMLGLSVLYLPVLIVPALVELSPTGRAVVTVVDVLIWLGFAAEFAILFVLAPSRRQMVRSHWLDLVIILVPFLRPLRALRVLRLLAVVGRAGTSVGRIMTRRGVQGYLAFSVLAVVVGALVVFVAERSHPDTSIDSFADALWWAIVTATTVGYGDTYPVTTEGRIAAVALMLTGIGLLGVVTASIAAVVIEQDEDDNLAAISAQLDRIEARLEAIEDARQATP
jgi:voltage-gated potassium channel